MQSLLPLSTATPATLPPAPANAASGPADGAAASAGPGATATSASVTLTDPRASQALQTYTPGGTLAPMTPVWEQDANDPVSTQIANNYQATPLADRFDGLGTALLERFQLNGGNYSQSVILRAPGSGADGSVSNLDSIRQSQLHTQSDNQVTLDIQTVSGATVHLSLASQGGGLGVQVQVTNGTLTDAERNALAGLADAFQDAVDGLTAVPPRLALDGLTQFDKTVLSSVDLQASFKLSDGSLQTLAFHADSQKRSVAYTSAAGSVNVDVDMSNPSVIGSAAQQSRALASYLGQFDQAQSRGHGDATLMTMFKDAFTALNSHYNVNPPQATSRAIALDDTDHAMMSGLADFSASVTQTADFSANPMRPGEEDAYSYQVSQSTRIAGPDTGNRSLKQTQQSHLTASYHQSLYPDTALDLTTDKHSQNYYYYQIDDSASSVADIAYREGRLDKASITQTASQSTHVMKYVMGDLEGDTTTPSSVSRSWNLLNLLNAAKPHDHSSTPLEQARWRDTLSAVGDLSIMKADPATLRAAGPGIAGSANVA
jgi:hypothetical protein